MGKTHEQYPEIEQGLDAAWFLNEELESVAEPNYHVSLYPTGKGIVARKESHDQKATRICRVQQINTYRLIRG